MSANGLAAIELVDVAKEFASHGEEVRAVEQVDLTIGAGEFFSLLGPSGCGKTTTLRMIAGFEEPSRGQILLFGKDMVGVPPYKRDVNMVFQSYALFPHMSVFENIAFGLRRKKAAKDDISRQVAEIVRIVHLEGMEQRRPTELSGGQQQRVALARALINKPRALLLDEPLAALDLKLRQNMQIELKRIQREVGIAFVFVTHDQGEALTLSDRLVVMNEGRVEQEGTPHELYERPANRFVAGFIGTSNIINGRIDRLVDGAGVLDLAPDEHLVVHGDGLTIGQQVEVTIRPEKIVVHPGSTTPPAGGSAVRGKVSDVVYLGTSTSYTVQVTGGAEVIVYAQNVLSSAAGTEQGDQVWLSWRPEHSFLLNQQRDANVAPAESAPVS